MHECALCSVRPHQQTVEEDMNKHPQAADEQVGEVVEELKVHHHGYVAPTEGATVPQKTHQEDDFITHLEDRWHLL